MLYRYIFIVTSLLVQSELHGGPIIPSGGVHTTLSGWGGEELWLLRRASLNELLHSGSTQGAPHSHIRRGVSKPHVGGRDLSMYTCPTTVDYCIGLLS